jgi:GNAT superfamily N-acetyltransferase
MMPYLSADTGESFAIAVVDVIDWLTEAHEAHDLLNVGRSLKAFAALPTLLFRIAPDSNSSNARSPADVASARLLQFASRDFSGIASDFLDDCDAMSRLSLTVSPHSQGQGDGEKILRRIEQRARSKGLESIFVLTTRTMHWFLKRGFVQAPIDWLPEARQRKYNLDRRSVVLVKKLT